MFHSTNPFNEINLLNSNNNINTNNNDEKTNWHNINKLSSIDSCCDDTISLQFVDRSLSSLSTTTNTSTTTTSTTTASDSIDYFYSDENDIALLRTIDPSPAEPPLYEHVNPSKHITFPIFENCSNSSNDILPIYTPAIHSITLGSIRLEYLDPETHASLLKSKIWSNFIIEINSTQLNMYAIDPSLLLSIKNYKDSVNPLTNKNLSIQQPQTHIFTKLQKDQILSKISQNRDKYLNSGSLRRTYTLQHSEFGLPSDFIRRNRLAQDQVNVLRVRCENQQFLIRLLDIDELIDWSTKLSQGIAVALDLQVRDLPDYRVFPRRRNRHHSRRNSHYNNNNIDDIEETEVEDDTDFTQSSRSVSPSPDPSILDPISRSTTNISRISSSASSLSLFPNSSTSAAKKSSKNPLIKKVISMFNSNNNNSNNPQRTERSRSSSISSTQIQQRNMSGSRSKRSVSVTNSIIETERSINQRLTATTNAVTAAAITAATTTTSEHGDDDDMDFYSDEEDEDYENGTDPSNDTDIKWCPVPKVTNRKKHISTSLRCLRVFNETHSWYGKIILKETHNPAKYDTINLPIYFINTATMSKAGSHHMRIKNHCLHPFVLSPNGLIKHGSKVFDLWYEMYN
ncbi:hypothetical protein C6P45_004316 [Maudiozyma exigua]|uniref:PH domain-containing protein n=1 Tax=Maudiozyma exigua TaxID=34358 RepID=A0A9P6WC08_MAUEX|nr:hypothetical protein C6P45_004316 [Kazachstania exigua]